MSAAFLPYGRQIIDDDDVAAVVRALRSDYLTTGPQVARFESLLAEKVGARFAVAVANGTAALHAACAAAGIGPGDEAIVPAITFIATANAVCYLGARPVFADVDPRSGLAGPEQIAAALTTKTRAILPVHLNGRPAPLKEIADLAADRRIAVIEDGAHALGASYRGRPVGCCAHSVMTVFSFHPIKSITTGEGGAVTTNDPALHERLRSFRNHGIVKDPDLLEESSPGPWYYEQQSLGFNYRISDLNCALGISQLGKLERFVESRRSLAARYDKLLSGLSGVRPVGAGPPDTVSAYHLYAVLIDFAELGISRRDLMAGLRSAGIGSQVHYIPVPSQPYYRAAGCDPSLFPNAWRYHSQTLSLPLYPAMTLADVDRVVETLARLLGDDRASQQGPG